MAIDIVARGLALSVLGADGKVSADKMPTFTIPSGEGVEFTPVGALTDVNWIKGRTAEEILQAILFGLVYPTLTEPEFNIEITSDTTIIAGVSTVIEGVLHFNRGEIIAADGSSTPRTGAATQYMVQGAEQENTGTDVPFSVTLTLDIGTHELIAQVTFEEGAQPVDSLGNPYSEPYAAGYLMTAAYLTAISNLTDALGNALTFTYFDDETGTGYQTVAASESTGVKQSFAVDVSTPILGIKQLNPITQSWEWIGGTAAASLKTFTIVEEEGIITYTHNGSAAGTRELQLYTQIKE